MRWFFFLFFYSLATIDSPKEIFKFSRGLSLLWFTFLTTYVTHDKNCTARRRSRVYFFYHSFVQCLVFKQTQSEQQCVFSAVAQHCRAYSRGTVSPDSPPSAQFVNHKSPTKHRVSASPSPSSVIACMENTSLDTSHLRQMYHFHSAARFHFQSQWYIVQTQSWPWTFHWKVTVLRKCCIRRVSDKQ